MFVFKCVLEEFFSVGGEVTMFDLFKRKNSEPVLYSPIEGKCIDLTEVPDQVFAQKIMGEGIAFIPLKDEIVAPCDGTISLVANTKHAIGMVNNDGVEILIHVGLDTVNLGGRGFEVYVKKDKKVKKGDVLLTFDRQFFESQNINLTTPMIITNYKNYNLSFEHINENVTNSEKIVTYKLK